MLFRSVEYVAEGLARAMEMIEGHIKEGSLKLKGITLTPKQEELLALLGQHGILGAAQICQFMTINRARVNQLMAPLVRFGIVTKEGAARSVRYRLSTK